MDFCGNLRRHGREVGVYFVEHEYDPGLCGNKVDVWVEVNGQKVHLPYRITRRHLPGGNALWKSESDGVMYNSLLFCVDNVLPADLTYYL